MILGKIPEKRQTLDILSWIKGLLIHNAMKRLQESTQMISAKNYICFSFVNVYLNG